MKNILLVTFCITGLLLNAQTNLVPNHNFKKTSTKKMKEKGQIALAEPWVSPTLAPADLYEPKNKVYDINIPDNAYGEEKPMDGEGYAGIIAYSYKGKVPRSYLQVKLTEQLEEGKEYCVKFHVSLADLSKYATNHIGIAVTDKAMTANNSDILKFDSYIESKRLTVYEKQFYWTPVCGIYKAKGGEEYITIGNFTEEEKLQIKKVKRPRGFTKPQTYDAYYYIDNISVIDKAEADKCDCDVIPGMENAETVNREFDSDKNVNTTTVKIINTDGTTNVQKPDSDSNKETTANAASDEDVDGMMIMFAPKLFDVDAKVSKLDKVVAYMKANPNAKIVLTGFYDSSESGVEKLDGKRVSAVYKYILSKGIPKERINRELGGDDPIDDKNKAKNMRVEIMVDSGDDGGDDGGDDE